MAQITHQVDPDDGHYIQIVSPAVLRDELDAAGSDYTRPEDFSEADEWDTDSDASSFRFGFILFASVGLDH